MARNTVMGAYEQLLAEGYLEGETGSGTYVARALPDKILQRWRLNAPVTPVRSQGRLSQRGEMLSRDPLGVRSGDSRAPFGPAVPALDQFPFGIWTRLLMKHWRRQPVDLLPYSTPGGYRPLREAIAQYVAAARAVKCDAEQIVIVSGAQQALGSLSEAAARSRRRRLDRGSGLWRCARGAAGCGSEAGCGSSRRRRARRGGGSAIVAKGATGLRHTFASVSDGRGDDAGASARAAALG